MLDRSGIAARRRAMIEATRGFEVDVRASYPQWFEDELAAAAPHVQEKE